MRMSKNSRSTFCGDISLVVGSGDSTAEMVKPSHSCILKVSPAPAGHVVFHGPREEVLPFFSSLGFQLPERKGIADFLQEVTSKKDQRVSP